MQNHRRKLRNIKRARKGTKEELTEVKQLLRQLLGEREPARGWKWHLHTRRDMLAQILVDFLNSMLEQHKLPCCQQITMDWVAPTTPARRKCSEARSASSQQNFLLPAQDPAPTAK